MANISIPYQFIIEKAPANNAGSLYVVLAWVFENRKNLEMDPLDMVAEIYADFGYPKEIAHFVRHMPMIGLDLGSKEKNEERLYDYWKAYLDEAAKRFVKS